VGEISRIERELVFAEHRVPPVPDHAPGADVGEHELGFQRAAIVDAGDQRGSLVDRSGQDGVHLEASAKILGGDGFHLPAGNTARTAGNPLLGSTVVTRAGGFSPDGMVSAVNSAQTPTLLQSPGEGQMLVLRTQQAAPLSHADFTHAFVQGQMDGLSSSDAFASALQDKGYLVYERPWDGSLEPMLKKAVL
jgi:hypothetical protein